MRKLLVIITMLAGSLLQGQDTLRRDRILLSYGVSLSPQMVFIGALDAGPYFSAEILPSRKGGISIYAGLEIRNKWFQLPVEGIGFNGKGLRTYYSLNLLLPVGIGYKFTSKTKPAANAFYLISSPVLFTYKDRVKNEYFTNSVTRSNKFLIYGLCWTNTKISRKGRIITSQFFIPVYGKHFLENLRNMSIKFGWTIEKIRRH